MRAKKKSLLSILLCLAVMLSFIPILGTTAYAQDSVSYLEKSWDDASKSVKATKKSRTDCVKVVVSGDDYTGPTWGEDGKTTWYVVSEDTSITGRITVKGTVNLILCDGKKLIAKKGITVTQDCGLNIYAQSDGSNAGTLWAGTEDGVSQFQVFNPGSGPTFVGYSNGAAIGGKQPDSNNHYLAKSGKVNIHGGNVVAYGGSASAGIGGGESGSVSETGGGTYGPEVISECDDITIYGGTVTAYAREGGAAIGVGNVEEDLDISDYDKYLGYETAGRCGNITIYSGKVTASANGGGAGIGGGVNGDLGRFEDNSNGVYHASTVAIYGGTVNASGGQGGTCAGIGAGTKISHPRGAGNGGNVIIDGGTVTATGGDFNGNSGPGIGSYSLDYDHHGSLTLGNGVKLETSDDGSAWTDTTSSTSTRKKYMRTLISYPLFVGGEQVTGANEADPGDRGWDYDDASKTLTLKDCKIDKGYEFDSKKAAIYANQDLTIQLEGDSNVALEDGYGIYVDGSGNALTIKGDGALTVAGGTKAIEGSVKNEIPGTGWTDFAGKEGKTDIPVSTTGQSLTYKKVHFPTDEYYVTVKNGTGSGVYREGDIVTIKANDPASGKQFKEWTGMDGLAFTEGDAKSATAKFTMPAKDITATATYEDIPASTPEPTSEPTSAPTSAPTKDTTKKEKSKSSNKATSVTIKAKTITAKTLAKAVKKAGGKVSKVKTVTLGKKVTKIAPKAFKKFKKLKTLVLKTKKLKKAGVKNSLKGSKITKIKVKVGSKKANKKFVKKYKKIFTKKNAGRKVKVV